jgi:hypothetical protein
VAATLVLGLVSLGALAGPGQSPAVGAPAAPAGALSLVTQSAFVRAGENFILCVRVDGVADPSQVELAVTTYARIENRTNFLRTIAGKSLRANLDLRRFPLERVQVGVCGADSFFVSVPPPPRASAGVYPVQVELRRADDTTSVLSGFVTHLVYVPSLPVTQPINVAVVLPVHDTPALQPGGARHLHRLTDLRALAGALESVPDVPVVLDPTPETLDSMAATDTGREALTSLRNSVRNRQLLAGPYVPVDLPALLGAQLGDEASAQLTAGSDVVAQRFLGEGQRPDPRTWVVRDPVDQESLADLRGRGFDRVVLPPTNLSPLRDDVDAANRARPFTVEARPGSRQTAFVADPDLTAHFVDGGDEVLHAHQLLADLAFIYFEVPNEPTGGRGVVAMAPRSWRPTSEFLRALLLGLRGNPVVSAVTLDALFTAVPAAVDRKRPLQRTLVPSPRSTSYSARSLKTARARLDGFASVLGRENPLPNRLRDNLLVSQSVDLRTNRRTAYLDAVDATIKSQMARVKLPTGRTITLTAREGEIPISFRNETGYPVHVQVRIHSDKLIVRDRDRVKDLDLARLNTTARFLVKARTSGDTGLNIVVESPDGSLRIADTLLTVRSTAASGVGLVLSVGAALFLVVWWGRDFRRGRRARRLVPE